MRAVAIHSSVRTLKTDKAKLKTAIGMLDTHFAPPTGSLSIIFVPHATLAQMHGEFCGDSTPTDIITFPFEGADGVFGELYISPQAAVEFVKRRGGKFDTELKRYVIHGYLHLLGYDDLTPKGRAQMRRLERVGLEKIKKIGKVFEIKSAALKKR